MEMTITDGIEILGTIAFAISGSFAAMQRRLDPFGVLIIAFVTSIGGGTLRDLLLGDTPVAWMRNINYCLLILVTSIITMIFRTHIKRFKVTLFLFDSIGLGLFTMVGAVSYTHLDVYKRQVASQAVAINTPNFVKDVQIKLKANKIGVQKFTINVASLTNEITTKNNNQTIFVEVSDARQKIILASAFPHPDLTVIKQAIALNKHYEVTLALADELDLSLIHI